MRKRGDRKAQVTIFIIVAIVIVAVILLIFYPRIQSVFSTVSTPSSYIEDCLNPSINEALSTIERQGGSLNPENTFSYEGEKVEYLCYTNEFYKTCTMQQPFLTQHVGTEIESYLKDKTKECMNQLAESYRGKGYQVIMGNPEVVVSLVPHVLLVDIKSPMTFTKETTESYSKFSIGKKSEIYDFLMIGQSILNWEARFGDSIAEDYMMYYPNLRVQKLKQSEGSKIYIITDKPSGEKFTFATRSLSWPSGGEGTYIK